MSVPSGSSLQESDRSGQLRGADGRTLQDYGKRQNLAEDRKQLETERLSRGGGDEADPECQLFVRERNRNILRERPFSELR